MSAFRLAYSASCCSILEQLCANWAILISFGEFITHDNPIWANLLLQINLHLSQAEKEQKAVARRAGASCCTRAEIVFFAWCMSELICNKVVLQLIYQMRTEALGVIRDQHGH